MFNQQLLTGRRILVTGGGTGLGKSMAARFLELGAEVHICGRRKSVCDETATELMDLYGGRVTSHGVDIRNPLAVDEMIEAIFTEGPLTDLINNAAGNFICSTDSASSAGPGTTERLFSRRLAARIASGLLPAISRATSKAAARGSSQIRVASP